MSCKVNQYFFSLKIYLNSFKTITGEQDRNHSLDHSLTFGTRVGYFKFMSSGNNIASTIDVVRYLGDSLCDSRAQEGRVNTGQAQEVCNLSSFPDKTENSCFLGYSN